MNAAITASLERISTAFGFDAFQPDTSPALAGRASFLSISYFLPTTAQRYTSSVTTRVISGLAPAAASSTSSSEKN